MNKRKIKAIPLILFFVFALSSLVSIVSAPQANAAPKTLADGVKSYIYYTAWEKCMSGKLFRSGFNSDFINPTDATTGAFFSDTRSTALGYISTGSPDCNVTGEWLVDAIKFWGWKTNTEALCSFGFTRDNLADDGSLTVANCVNGNGNFFLPSTDFDITTSMKKAIEEKYYGKRGRPELSSAQKYVLYYNSFVNLCEAKPVVASADANADQKTLLSSDNGYELFVLDEKYNKQKVIFEAAKGKGVKIDVYQGEYISCIDIVAAINSNIDGYQDYMRKNKGTEPKPTSVASLVQTGGTSGNEGTSGSCDIAGVGWIICPVVNFMASVADNAYVFIEDNFLSIKAELFTAADNPTRDAWSIALGLANSGLIVVFLVIIFAQVTGVGVSNYGIKKMLPRLLIAAILINLSFFIVQLAVDISNLLGKTIYQSLSDLAPDTTGGSTGIGGSSGNLTVISGTVLASVTAVAGGVVLFSGWATLTALIPVLLAVVVAVVMMFFILVARQALVILLVVLAPLAFLAFILPNTANLFTRWRKTLVALLLLYPIVALIMGTSKFAAALLTNVYGGEVLGGIIAAAVSVLPLFLVPSILKKSLDSIPAIGQYAQRLQGRATGAVSQKSKAAYQRSDFARSRAMRRADIEKKRGLAYAERTVAGGARGVGSRAGGIGSTDAIRTAAQGTIDQAEAERREREDRQYDDAWKDQARTLTHAEKVQRIQSGTLSASVAQAAARDVMRTGDQAAVTSLLGHASSTAGQDIRDTVARTAGESPALSSSAHLNAADITRTLNTPGGAIDQTYIDKQISTKAQQGGYTRTAMANMSSHDAELLASAAGRMAAGSTERQALITEAQDAMTDPRLAVVQNSDLGRHLTAIANMTP